MSRLATLSTIIAIVTATIWLANAVENVVPIEACTLARMQVESYLLMARAFAIVLPVGGLAVLYVVGAFLHVVPVNHFGGLRG